MVIEQAVLDPNQLLRVVQRQTQPPCALHRRQHFLAAGALLIDECLIQRDLQVELATTGLLRGRKPIDLPKRLARGGGPEPIACRCPAKGKSAALSGC